MNDALRLAILERLRRGPATLADLRAHLPAGHVEAVAAPSMGEEDPFGAEVVALVAEGAVEDLGGTYRLVR